MTHSMQSAIRLSLIELAATIAGLRVASLPLITASSRNLSSNPPSTSQARVAELVNMSIASFPSRPVTQSFPPSPR